MKDVEDIGCGNRLVNILSAAQCRTKVHVGHSRFPSELNSVNMQKAECSLFIYWIRDPATLLNLFFCQEANWQPKLCAIYFLIFNVCVLHNKNIRGVEVQLQLDHFHFEADHSFEWKINGYSKLYFPVHRYTWK